MYGVARMPTYAVKLAEIQLQSNEPISAELRKLAIERLRQDIDSFFGDLGHGLTLRLQLPEH
jgi:hypothetical protein